MAGFGCNGEVMECKVEIEQETDDHWTAEVPNLPGVMAYGDTGENVLAKVKALVLRVIADRLENGETASGLPSIPFAA